MTPAGFENPDVEAINRGVAAAISPRRPKTDMHTFGRLPPIFDPCVRLTGGVADIELKSEDDNDNAGAVS